MIKLIATFFYIGYLRPASGSWASAIAIALGLLINAFWGLAGFIICFLLVTMIGFWACKKIFETHPGEDPSEVVIDEVSGQWLALLFPILAFFYGPGIEGALPWPAWVGAFLFFRLFDIWKPWLVGKADRRKDWAGIMIDDLWAGLFAGIAVIITGILWHIVVF